MIVITMEDDSSISRAIGILTGIIGIMGVVMPFTKQPLRESLQISMMGVGISLSLLSIISKTTKTTSLNNQTNNEQKNSN